MVGGGLKSRAPRGLLFRVAPDVAVDSYAVRRPGRTERRLALLAPGSNGQLPNMDLINTVVRVTPRQFTLVLDRNAGSDAFSAAGAAAEESGLLPAATGAWYWPRLEAVLRFMQVSADVLGTKPARASPLAG